MAQQLISIIVPFYNEAPNIAPLFDQLRQHTARLPYDFEMVFVDDGSADDSAAMVRHCAEVDARVRLVQLARNFGKEAAMSAGLHTARGDAAIILDADLQHPPQIMGKFIRKWRRGAEVVVGIKRYGKSDGWFKRITSDWFYRLLKPVSETEITPHAADYRLLDRCVIDAFSGLREHNRITRGLIDWLGFKRDYVYFTVKPRHEGQRSYTFRKLFRLAINSFTAYSLLPLRLAGYLGEVMLVLTIPSGLFLSIETYILGDPLNLHVTSAGMLAILTIFLVGVILACMGFMGMYIAHIYAEVIDRPLYVIRDQIDAGELAETKRVEAIVREAVKG